MEPFLGFRSSFKRELRVTNNKRERKRGEAEQVKHASFVACIYTRGIGLSAACAIPKTTVPEHEGTSLPLSPHTFRC